MTTYIFQILPQEPLPKAVARALGEYIEKYGPPPGILETIEVKVDGGDVIITEVTVKETT